MIGFNIHRQPKINNEYTEFYLKQFGIGKFILLWSRVIYASLIFN